MKPFDPKTPPDPRPASARTWDGVKITLGMKLFYKAFSLTELAEASYEGRKLPEWCDGHSIVECHAEQVEGDFVWTGKAWSKGVAFVADSERAYAHAAATRPA